jgi:hypothetical protein
MLLNRLVLSALWVAAVLVGHQMWTARVSASHHAPAPAVFSLPAGEDRETGRAADFGARPRLDVYGNEIDEAIGDYRVDPRGDTYESHSPDTALLKLGPAGA